MKTKVILQYYYKTDNCKAKDAKDSDCVCWHDEGTGSRKTELHTDETPKVAWRIKPNHTT